MDEEISQALQEMRDEIRALREQVTALVQKSASPVRSEYSRQEFAEMVGVSPQTLKHEKYWRRYGGKKRGGRIRFSEAARLAIVNGKAA